MDKENAKREIGQLVEKFRKVPSDELDRKSEEQIKFEYIEPLLLALGWRREDIEKEQRVLKGRADYILKIGNQEVLVIEAKRTGVQLTEEEGRQAVSYAYHRKIKFAVLTNFKQVRIYHALSNIKNINKNLLRDQRGHLWINCESFDEDFNRLWLLSRESFEKGEANKLLSAKDERLSKPIDESILDDLLQYRDWLSKDLKKLRMYLSDPQIDEIVQILIDRLIFMRSVEDRGLEEKDFLLNIVKDFQQGRTTRRLWELLKEQFRIFNKTYNSKLFEEELLEKEGFFDEDTLIKVINGLYFGTKGQQERYLFDEVRVDLLGNIYEQYLGTILKGTEKRVKLEEGTGKRKKMGIYYTPSYIVDYIVKNAVGEYIKDKTIDEILGVRILDPACGSGSFLIRAFREVCEAVEGRLKKGERSNKWHTFKDYKGRLNLGQKITILTNCIYGVDLDEKAVELAQLNLLLRLLEDETRETKKRLLPPMKDNIKCGNSLIDDLAVSDKAFNWKAQFPDIFGHDGFDIVIGNPPWVQSKFLSESDKKIYSNKYQVAKKQYDLFTLFIESSLQNLKDESVLGFIIPDRFISNLDYEPFRGFLLNNCKILKIIHLGDDVFPEVNMPSAILIIKKEKSPTERDANAVEYARRDGEESMANLKYAKKNQAEFSKNEGLIFSIFSGAPSDVILIKIRRNSINFGEIVNNARGVEIGKDSKLITDKEVPGKSAKFLVGEDIDRYKLVSKRYIILNERDVDYKEPELYKGPKILIRKTGLGIRAVLDTEDHYVIQVIYIFKTKRKDIDERYLLGIINSKLIQFYYFSIFGERDRKTFPHLTQGKVLQLPIKITSESEQQPLISLVDQVLALQKKYHEENLAGREKELMEQQIKQVDWQIDEEVYKLYGITEEEKKIIEESLR